MLLFENAISRISLAEYYFPKVEIKDYNFVINGENIFEELMKSYIKAY